MLPPIDIWLSPLPGTGLFLKAEFCLKFHWISENFNGLNKWSTFQSATYVSKDVKFLHESFL